MSRGTALEAAPPQRERRFRYPRRKPLPDRGALYGVLYVLHTGIRWEFLSLRDWNEVGV